MTHSHSRGFGVTGEIHTTADYELTQAWADALHRAEFDGIRYLVRHDPAQNLVGIALFGLAGVHDDALVEVATSPIPASLLDEARDHFGIMVLPTP